MSGIGAAWTADRRARQAAIMRTRWADHDARRVLLETRAQWVATARLAGRLHALPRPPKFSWPPEMISALREFRDAGLIMKVCAKRLGVGYRVCAEKCVELGINRLPGHRGGRQRKNTQ